jgi:hypothetical protein
METTKLIRSGYGMAVLANGIVYDNYVTYPVAKYPHPYTVVGVECWRSADAVYGAHLRCPLGLDPAEYALWLSGPQTATPMPVDQSALPPGVRRDRCNCHPDCAYLDYDRCTKHGVKLYANTECCQECDMECELVE